MEESNKKGMKKVVYKEEYIEDSFAYIYYNYIDVDHEIQVHMHTVNILLPKKWMVLDDTGISIVAGQELTRFWGELFPDNLNFRQTLRSFSNEKEAKDFIKTVIYEIDFVNRNIDEKDRIEIFVQ